MSFTSWGGLPSPAQEVVQLRWGDQVDVALQRAGLVVGAGRSYGDSGLAANGCVACCRGMDRFLEFDPTRGILRCEAGVTLGQILNFSLPRGWCLPVVPGTQYVTVAGALANDVHGKNQHSQGSFGCHVVAFTLRRSSGDTLLCSADENTDWYRATIGGLGLTGVILEAQLQLMPVAGGWLDSEHIKFTRLREFLELSLESEADWAYSAAWIDCLDRRGRGIFTRANHLSEPGACEPTRTLFKLPFTVPVSPLNTLSLRLFNSCFFHRQWQRTRRLQTSFMGWNFPLDRIGNWNRFYGPGGLRQYQCVVPFERVELLLRLIREAGQGSFLAVLKMFGKRSSPGLLSFPRAGATLALDFPWRGEQTLTLFRKLDRVVMDCDGAVYPAKDAHMSAELFRQAYPEWEHFAEFLDPGLKSLFWQRVAGETI